jgi:hypothetical protein
MRRHIEMCLKAFPVTDEQRAVVRELSAKYVSEAMYAETDSDGACIAVSRWFSRRTERAA